MCDQPNALAKRVKRAHKYSHRHKTGTDPHNHTHTRTRFCAWHMMPKHVLIHAREITLRSRNHTTLNISAHRGEGARRCVPAVVARRAVHAREDDVPHPAIPSRLSHRTAIAHSSHLDQSEPQSKKQGTDQFSALPRTRGRTTVESLENHCCCDPHLTCPGMDALVPTWWGQTLVCGGRVSQTD